MSERQGGAVAQPDEAQAGTEDLLAEMSWIAVQAGIVRRTKAGVWVPDLDKLGQEIGGSHNRLKAARSGGDPGLRTLRLLLGFARRTIPGYNAVRLARAVRLLSDEDILRAVQGDPATGAALVTLVDQSRQAAALSEQDLRAVQRWLEANLQAIHQAAPNVTQPPSAAPSPPLGPAARDASNTPPSPGQ